MKKMTAVCLALFMCLTFAGCGEPTVPQDTDSGGSGIISPDPDGAGNTHGNDNNREENAVVPAKITKIYIRINGNKPEITLAENSSVDALVAVLQKGDVTIATDDYGGFEKVGSLGFSLPQNDTRITMQPGDVMLYQGNSISLSYGTNSWSYTRIGKIEGYSQSELRTLLGAGNGSTTVTLSLN